MCCSAKYTKPSTAYLKLNNADLVPVLKWVLESRPMVDEQGQTFQCQVELAPFQKVPKQSRRQDPREGTYDRGSLPYCQLSLR